jgi:hypothetical protein
MWAAGFVTRGAFSPQTTCSPCWRRCRPAPPPVCALRRLVKRRGERPPLQPGAPGAPGSTTSRSRPHTGQPCCERVRRALATVRSVPPERRRDLRPSRRGPSACRTAPSGKTPVLQNRQSASNSLRARATIPSWRSRARPDPHRRSSHRQRALAGWKRRHAQALAIAIARRCRWPAVARPSARRDWPR